MLGALLAPSVPARGETLVLTGSMGGRITLEIAERYEPQPGTSWISLKTYRTPTFGSTTWQQTLVSEDAVYSTRPAQSNVTRDDAGNLLLTERWEHPSAPIQVTRRLVVETKSALPTVQSRAAFPVGAVAPDAARFLKSTGMVQSADPRIRDLARRLTSASGSARGAVETILNYVVDHVQYQYDPPAHDALSALDRRIANCQGYAHLSMALLRAAGIPARVTVGISLSKGWRVQHPDGTITFKMGQGRHAWIEVFYPDVGWIPYDPQTSHLFVSIYHVRQAVGLDARETLGIISASPRLPTIQESIQGDGSDETFAIRTVKRTPEPKNFIVATDAADLIAPPAPPIPPAIVTPPSPVTPPPTGVTPPAPVRREQLTQFAEFGNLEFPAALRIFGATEATAGAEQARRTFIVETAEYATGTEEFAQAFAVTTPLLLSDVSLALQKFGGSTGSLWVELFDETGRKPGRRLAESRHLPVSGLVDRGGYRWVIFDMTQQDGGVVLQPGRYWIVFRASGDGIFNWYFSLGKGSGDPDDSRSRLRGAPDWANMLSYRFNFRVTGMGKP